MKINVSGKLYDIAPYEVSPETHRIDMDEVERIAKERRPKLLLAGWSAYPRLLDFERFRAIADEVGALLMVDMAHFAGLVAAGLHPIPVPYADVVTTTIHKTLGGAARRHDPVPRGVRQEDQLGGVPGPAGRPAGARDRRQGGGAQDRRARSSFRERQAAHGRGREGRRRRAARHRPRRERAHRRHRRAPRARRPARLRARRPAGRGPPARHRHHGQPQRGPVRPAPADGHQRPARRHARRSPPAACRRTTSPRSGAIISTALQPDFESSARRAGRARHGDRRPLPALRAAGRTTAAV